MANEAYVRRARLEDIAELVPTLRDVDVRECRELGGLEPADALEIGISNGCSFVIVNEHQQVVAAFGVAPTLLVGVGVGWLLGSDAMLCPSIRRRFVRESRLWLNSLHHIYPVIVNTILAENRFAIRWLKWLGFEFNPTDTDGVLQFRRMAACATP